MAIKIIGIIKLALNLAFTVSLTHVYAVAAPTALIGQTDGVFFGGKWKFSKGWLALVQRDSSFSLEPTQIKFNKRLLPNESTYSEPACLYWSLHPDTRFLLRHQSLRAGKVEMLHLPDSGHQISYWDKRTPASLKFFGSEYRFNLVHRGPNNPANTAADNRKVFIESQGRKTLLKDWNVDNGTDDNHERIVWAGDLDGDGRLDLIIVFTAYASSTTCLFLSGAAGPGEVLRQVGCHYIGS